MPKSNNPRKTWKHSKDFKIKAVLYSFQDGVRNQQASDGLGIHPYMLSRWRTEYLDGKLRRQRPRASRVNNNEKSKVNKKELTGNIKLNYPLGNYD